MSFLRNPEIRRALLCVFGVTAACAGAGLLVSVPCALLALVSCVLLGTLFFVWTRRRYRHIAALSEQLDHILHGNDSVELSAFSEGELAILRDELYKMTVRLREQADALLADRARLADAMADISHQLRTPLTAMHLNLSLLQSGTVSEARRMALLQEVAALLTRFDWLVDAMLKVSRIDAGAVRFRQERVCALDLVRRAAQPLEIAIELRGQSLSMDVPPDLPLWCDLQWTAEAVGNVLKNCVEHMPQGGTLTVHAAGNAIYTELIVEDDGAGIDPADLPHLFDRFYRGKNASPQSAGIGLALTRMILSAQGGTIRAENRAEGGARFMIRLYRQTAEPGPS